MEPILARCGFRCNLCLAYRPNVTQNPANRQKASDGWFKYFGFRIPPEDICCDGCLADTPTLDRDCPVRPCVVARGLETCAQCEQYVCNKLAQRLVDYEQIKQRLGGEIPEDDYLCFIRPGENKRRLEALRSCSGCCGCGAEKG